MPSFNLIDHSWIPVADAGRVSLMDVFTHPEYRALGGNPVQKIALMKLLLAIAQAACTPKDEAEWKALGVEGMAKACREYLEKWHDRFDLYGEKPFLQMPGIKRLIQEKMKKRADAEKAKKKTKAAAEAVPLQSGIKSLGSGMYPDIPSDNNTVLSHTLLAREMSDADKALFIMTLMNFSLGGKRVEDQIVTLAGTELKKLHTAMPGPSMGKDDRRNEASKNGQLHCFVTTGSLQKDININVLSHWHLEGLNRWRGNGLGVPFWEKMPKNESDEIAEKHKKTYQSCLIAMSRFVLLEDSGIFFMDGIRYPSVRDGWYEPTLMIDTTKEQHEVKRVDVNKKPWRELQSFLSFLETGSVFGFKCYALDLGMKRLEGTKQKFAICSVGLQVHNNSGDQSVRKDNDFIESTIWLDDKWLGGIPFAEYKNEMRELEELGSNLSYRVKSYFYLLTDPQNKGTVSGKNKNQFVKEIPQHAANMFWQLCEREAQELVDACSTPDETRHVELHKLRRRFATYLQQTYDQFCPRETARQMDAWAQCRPNVGRYLATNEGETP